MSRVSLSRNLLVTGLPRSGTTLLAALVDSAPDAICLSEPPLRLAKPHVEPAAFTRAMRTEFAETRARLMAGLPLEERRGPAGERLTNYLVREGERKEPMLIASMQPVIRHRPVAADVILALKSNAAFLSALPELAASDEFECAAILRHPRAIFASWLTSGMPIAQGLFAIHRWPAMAAIAAHTELTDAEKLAHVYDTAVRRIVDTPSVVVFDFDVMTYAPKSVFERLRLTMGEVGLVQPVAEHSYDERVLRAVDALRGLNGPASSLYAL